MATKQDMPDESAIRAEIAPLFEDLRRFVDRRFAELSTELHAATQLVDFSETNLSGQLARIQEQIGLVIATPAAATRNSGLELEAVVEATEAAANRIMFAAEFIGDWLRDGERDPDSLAAVAEKVQTIFEACTFQDVTGQRIRRAIEHLRRVEAILTEIVPPGALARDSATPPAEGDPDLFQHDVDRMFA